MFDFGLGTWLKIGAAIALLVLIGVGWYKVDHWCNSVCMDERTKKQEIQLAYKNAVDTANRQIATLEQNNATLTENYKDAAKKYAMLSVEKQKDEIKLIMQDKELRSIRLSNHAVSVSNQPANTGSAYSQGITVPNPGNDGKAGTVGAPDEELAQASADSGFTLADLLSVDKRNEARYNICVAQVTDWQGFWTRFVDNYKKLAPE